MNYNNYIDVAAGLLQMIVAGYALWLRWRFGAVRVGWWLFSAFASLALLHWALAENFVPDFAERRILVDLAYAFTSILLLVGMIHMDALLKWYRDAEETARQAQAAEQQARVDLENTIKAEAEKVTKANEELQQTAQRLKAEIDERQAQKEREEKTHKEMMEVSRQAGMSEVATAVLHNVGNVLNSVNISAELVSNHVAEFKIKNIAQIARLMHENEANLGYYLTKDPKGRQLPDYLAKLAAHLGSEQTAILKEIGFVRSKIEHIKQIVATQQNYGKVIGLTESIRMEELVEDVLRIQTVELLENRVNVRREYEPRMPEIMVDKHKVLQILLNLVNNAKHACLESEQSTKEVKIRVSNGSERIQVTVSDNGVGIVAGNLKKIFNHGFTTKKSGGHGFGLHGSALAAKELGGKLAASSDGPGKGAIFTLEIPVKAPRQPYVYEH